MILWLIFAILTTLAVLTVLVPLGRSRREASRAADHDREVYRDQLDELERERQSGLIGEKEAEAARTEIARRLIAADRESGAGSQRDGSLFARRTASLIALILVPGIALGLYLLLGNPNLPDQPLSARLDRAPEQQSIEELVARVEEHLAGNPEDGQGWEVLAPTYLRMGRADDAARAFGNAIRILGSTAPRQANLGEAIIMANGGVVTGEARIAFERAVEHQPDFAKALFFLGLAREQEGDLAGAAKDWSALLAEAPPNAPWRPMVAAALSRLQAESPDLAPKVQMAANDADPSTPEVPAIAGPTQDDIMAASTMTPEERQAMIGAMVEGLADRLKSESGSVDEWLQLVRAYTVMGQHEEALDAARLALDDLPESDGVRVRILIADLGLTLDEEASQ